MAIDADSPYKSLQDYQSEGDYISDNSQMKRRIHDLSHGLTEVTGTNVTQFIHQSVKDFFGNEGFSTLETSQTDSKIVTGYAHHRLAKICIRYLATEEIIVSDRDRLTSAFPLLRYATTSWLAHARQSETTGVPNNDLLEYFNWPSEHLVQRWVQVYQVLDPISRDCPPKGISMIHIVSRYQLMGPLETILRRMDQVSTYINAEDNNGRTPLLYAAERGHEAVVEKLLLQGADEDSRDHTSWTPLFYSAGRGHEAVVKQLLAKKVNINAQDKIGAIVLHWIAFRGHEAIISLLLENAANIEAKEIGDATPLAWAIESGSEATVRLLLKRGSEVNY